MGINEILGRKQKMSNEEYPRCMIGECTELAKEVLDGRRDVYLREKGQSKAQMLKCPECGLIDCVLRKSAKDKFPSSTRCPRCNTRQERLFS